MTQAAVQIVIPTYNERSNLESLISSIRHYQPRVGILIVDDNSPDGTGEVAEQMAQRDQLLRVLHRTGPKGFGRSLIDGMLHAINLGPEFVLQMDADFSHNPQYLSDILAAAPENDVVIGSRYVGNCVSVVNWPLPRLFLSVFANYYVRTITGMRVHDTTGGYRCWRAEALKMIDLPSIHSDGYSFQVETLYRAHRLGLRITEVPIIFVERRAGASKMSQGVILESALMPWRLRLSSMFGGRKKSASTPEHVKSSG